MRGSFWLLDEPTEERAIACRIKAQANEAGMFARDNPWQISGFIDAERMASNRDLAGTIALRLFEDRQVTYRLKFKGDDGRAYELSGIEEWSKLAPIESLTLLPASVYDDRGEEVARATLRFDLRSDWASWLRSFRVEWPSREPRRP